MEEDLNVIPTDERRALDHLYSTLVKRGMFVDARDIGEFRYTLYMTGQLRRYHLTQVSICYLWRKYKERKSLFNGQEQSIDPTILRGSGREES